MSLIERVQAVEEERHRDEAVRERVGIESLRAAVAEVMPFERVDCVQ